LAKNAYANQTLTTTNAKESNCTQFKVGGLTNGWPFPVIVKNWVKRL
jgi:hypothetical protein